MARIWANALGMPLSTIAPTDHFVRLGGHSLSALRCVRLVRRALVGEDRNELEDTFGTMHGPFAIKVGGVGCVC